MPVTVARFNLVDPHGTPGTLSARYRAALEMARYADDRGIGPVQTEEHHGTDNDWLPSPPAFAGAVLGATRRITVTVPAIIGPLYDPLRAAGVLAPNEAVEYSGEPGAAPAVRPDAGGRGPAEPAPAVRTGAAPAREVSRGSTACVRSGVVAGDGYPISSNALPLVSGTHLRMNGIESTAKTV